MAGEHDPLDLRGQERIGSDKAARERVEREVEEADIRWLMSNKRGRRIVWRMLDQAGVFRTSFNTNALSMAFAEGNRNYGLRMLAQVNMLCNEQYTLMTKENTNV